MKQRGNVWLSVGSAGGGQEKRIVRKGNCDLDSCSVPISMERAFKICIISQNGPCGRMSVWTKFNQGTKNVQI